jgi:signal transduction histidine kinase
MLARIRGQRGSRLAHNDGGIGHARSDRGLRLALVVGLLLLASVALFAAEDAFEIRNAIGLTFLTAGLVGVMAMLVAALLDLRSAEARAEAALGRAAAAEAEQRTRADELTRVLQASQSLVLQGAGRVDYLAFLAAITPAGSTSFLVRKEPGAEGRVAEAHGPLAATVLNRAGHGPVLESGACDDSVNLVSYSASGRSVGAPACRAHVEAIDPPVQSALSVRLVAHDGMSLGWLHIIDPLDERVLEPQFVALARLVASQVAVAMENHGLLIGARRQVVEVQRVQEQLVQASKLGAIGELAAAVAHEVNNPLTGILGFAEILLAELPADDSRHDEVVIIRDEAVRARTIIRSLLEFARPRPPQRTPTDLNELTRSTIDLIRFRAVGERIELTEDYAQLPSLAIDPDAIKQALLNLCNNAIDAMPHGGNLDVSTFAEGDRAGIAVADTGVGMDQETMSRLFSPFISPRTRGGYGSGLGLSVSLRLVEGHGGTIEVISEPGRGATFTIWLPAAMPGGDGGQQAEPAVAAGAGRGEAVA